jgi:hypothetical protein
VGKGHLWSCFTAKCFKKEHLERFNCCFVLNNDIFIYISYYIITYNYIHQPCILYIYILYIFIYIYIENSASETGMRTSVAPWMTFSLSTTCPGRRRGLERTPSPRFEGPTAFVSQCGILHGGKKLKTCAWNNIIYIQRERVMYLYFKKISGIYDLIKYLYYLCICTCSCST